MKVKLLGLKLAMLSVKSGKIARQGNEAFKKFLEKFDGGEDF